MTNLSTLLGSIKFVKRTLKMLIGKVQFHWTYLVPFAMFAAALAVRLSLFAEPLSIAAQATLARLVIMEIAAALSFLHISLAAGHHHPEVTAVFSLPLVLQSSSRCPIDCKLKLRFSVIGLACGRSTA